MAELLAAKGYDVVAVARREARLCDLQKQLEGRWGVRVHPLACDLADQGAPAYIRDEMSRRSLDIDFLVNNAGYVVYSPYQAMPWEDGLRYIQVTALSPAELCRHFLPAMVDRRWGRIINVASIAAVLPGTPMTVLYGASKSFVLKLTEGLAAEVEQCGVNCTVIIVGATDTEMVETSVSPEFADALMMQAAMMRPEAVARKSYSACIRGKRVTAPGWHNKVWSFATVHSPPAFRYQLAQASVRSQP